MAHYGGGLDIYREVYDQHNIVGMPCNILAPEASGWFQDEIMSTEDLKRENAPSSVLVPR